MKKELETVLSLWGWRSSAKTGQVPRALAVTVGIALLSPLLGLDMLVDSGYHDMQRWLELGTFAIIAVLALRRLGNSGVQLPNPHALGSWLALLLVVLGLASTMLSDSPEMAYFEVGVFFFLILTAWLIAAEVSQASSACMQQALTWLVVGILLYGFKTLVIYSAALLSGDQPHPGNLIPGFDNYRFFNHGQTVTLPLLGLFVCLMRGRGALAHRWRAAGWTALVLWWMLLFVSSGRGTLVATTVSIALVGLWRGNLAWPWVRTMALGALAGLAAYGALYVAIPQMFGMESFGFLERVVGRSIADPGSGRGGLWMCAAQMAVQHPWLGAGPLHFAQDCASLQIAAHPHNWILQVASEWGLIALACVVLILARAARNLHSCGALIRAQDAPAQAMLTCWLATGLAIALDGLVSGLLIMPVSQLWIAVYIGLTWGWVQSLQAVPMLQNQSLASRLTVGFFILAGAGLLAMGVEATHAFAQLPRSALLLLAPRAWGAGFFPN